MAHHPKINRTMQRAFANCVEGALATLREGNVICSPEDEDAIINAIGESIATHNGQPAGGWDNWFWKEEEEE